MHTRTIVLAAVLLCIASHAHAAPNNYDEAVRLAKTEVPAIRDFIKCFPQSLHFITYYTGEAGPTSWNGEAGLFGRYEVTLTIDITLDEKRLHVIKWGAATITINEVTNCVLCAAAIAGCGGAEKSSAPGPLTQRATAPVKAVTPVTINENYVAGTCPHTDRLIVGCRANGFAARSDPKWSDQERHEIDVALNAYMTLADLHNCRIILLARVRRTAAGAAVSIPLILIDDNNHCLGITPGSGMIEAAVFPDDRVTFQPTF